MCTADRKQGQRRKLTRGDEHAGEPVKEAGVGGSAETVPAEGAAAEVRSRQRRMGPAWGEQGRQGGAHREVCQTGNTASRLWL